MAVIQGETLRMIRSIALETADFSEVLSELYPTLAYTEDQLAARPEQILLCGFDRATSDVQARLESELGLAAAPLTSRFGVPGEHNAGLLGYLESLEES